MPATCVARSQTTTAPSNWTPIVTIFIGSAALLTCASTKVRIVLLRCEYAEDYCSWGASESASASADRVGPDSVRVRADRACSFLIVGYLSISYAVQLSPNPTTGSSAPLKLVHCSRVLVDCSLDRQFGRECRL